MKGKTIELLAASLLLTSGCEAAGSSDVDPVREAAPGDDGNGVTPGQEGAADPAAAAANQGPATAEDLRSAVSRGGTYTLQWRAAAGGDVPTNEHFEVEVWLYRGPDEDGNLVPLPGAGLAISGWMPDHGHGMIRRPQATDRGEGAYLVKGMLFHMRGHWQLFFDILEDGLSERVEFEVDL